MSELPQPISHPPVVDSLPEPRRGPSPKRSVFIPATVALAIGTIFVTIFLAAFHAPEPHGLGIGIVTDGQTETTEKEISESADGTFSFALYATLEDARSAVENREVLGAFGTTDGTADLLYAGANGPAVTGTLQSIFGPVAKLSGTQLVMTDVAPSSAGDTRGLSIFYAGFGIVLAGYLFGLVSYQMAPRLLFRLRVLSVAAFSIIGGAVTTAIAGSVGFNALPGNLAAIGGISMLLAAAVSCATLLLMRVGGPLGTVLASAILLILGNASGGGTLPIAFLPEWLQPLSHVLPVGIGIRALQGVSYFNYDGFGLGLSLLAVWAVGSLSMVYIMDRLSVRSMSGRSTAPRHALVMSESKTTPNRAIDTNLSDA